MIQAASNGKSGIYAIVNVINGKRYIGSSANIPKRFKNHKRKLLTSTHENTHFNRAVLKYGFNNFVFMILEYCDSDALIEKESEWLSFFKKERLYNLRQVTQSNLGVKFSQETKDKMSKYQERNKKPVQQYDLFEDILLCEYHSAKEAAEAVGVAHQRIRHVCNRFYTSVGEYRWKFSNDSKPLPKAKNKRRTLQIDKDTGEIINVFNSPAHAAKVTGLSRENINNVLSGKSKTSCGYIWKYDESE